MDLKTEHEEQKEFVRWFRECYENTKGVRIFAIPNGGHRNKITASKMKAEGLRSGVPDLFIPEWRLWVEMKREKGGVLSDNQKIWRDYLLSNKYFYVVCNGFENAKKTILEFTGDKELV